MVRRSDEGCTATQKLDFLRSRQRLGHKTYIDATIRFSDMLNRKSERILRSDSTVFDPELRPKSFRGVSERI